MRIIYKILGIVLFILLMGFALKNAYPVTLFYYLGLSWQAPLSLILFTALITGIAAGLIAITPTLIKQRRELNKLRKENANAAINHQGAQ
ncbi:MAG: LapA family protein [Candidatus Methylopumilus sp.]|jgi:uncharacterized integral membrane protein